MSSKHFALRFIFRCLRNTTAKSEYYFRHISVCISATNISASNGQIFGKFYVGNIY